MHAIDKLNVMSSFAKNRSTMGISLNDIERFIKIDPLLDHAISHAHEKHAEILKTQKEFLCLTEQDQIEFLQKSFINFYDKHTINPYVALSAKGPWIVTTCGAVIYDVGGYGMLGFGHNPTWLAPILSDEYVMANIMTASLYQKRFEKTLRSQIGFKREETSRHPYSRFMCLNSGSEAVTLAARFADTNSAIQTKAGSYHHGKKIKFLSLEGSFHGRTDRPAQVSDSCLKSYQQNLASFKDRNNLDTVIPNDIESLKSTFELAAQNNVFYEAFFFEPVMGEGNPGLSISREFYDVARDFCSKNKTLLIVDSIQAGLRANGCLSICDYPGFEDCIPPDLESFSKALNAGQYPFSVLALGETAASLYKIGTYGNTMTTNPRALAISSEVLTRVDQKLRENICTMGREFVRQLTILKKEFPQIIMSVQGTGLLFSIEISPKSAKVVGENGLESRLRKQGIGVIHGGSNALRFTPHFHVSMEEVFLVAKVLRNILKSI